MPRKADAGCSTAAGDNHKIESGSCVPANAISAGHALSPRATIGARGWPGMDGCRSGALGSDLREQVLAGLFVEIGLEGEFRLQ